MQNQLLNRIVLQKRIRLLSARAVIALVVGAFLIVVVIPPVVGAVRNVACRIVITSGQSNVLLYGSDSGLHVVDSQGRGSCIATGETVYALDIDPTGRYIAYVNEDFDIYVLDLTTITFPTRKVADGCGCFSDVNVEWSPDGKHIVYINDSEAKEFGSAIYTVNVETGEVSLLVDDAEHNVGLPTWSPDGSRVAYTSGASSLYVREADGTVQLLSDTVDVADAPVWSPDGTRIAYINDDYDPTVLHMDTREITVYPRPAKLRMGVVTAMRWSPSGESMILTTFSVSDRDIYLLDFEFGEYEPILASPDDEGGARWDGDDSHIFFYRADSRWSDEAEIVRINILFGDATHIAWVN
jgi:Tol biopolymer transport system component